MKDEVLIHNLFKEAPERFFHENPHLRRAAAQPFSYVAPVMAIPSRTPVTHLDAMARPSWLPRTST